MGGGPGDEAGEDLAIGMTGLMQVHAVQGMARTDEQAVHPHHQRAHRGEGARVGRGVILQQFVLDRLDLGFEVDVDGSKAVGHGVEDQAQRRGRPGDDGAGVDVALHGLGALYGMVAGGDDHRRADRDAQDADARLAAGEVQFQIVQDQADGLALDDAVLGVVDGEQEGGRRHRYRLGLRQPAQGALIGQVEVQPAEAVRRLVGVQQVGVGHLRRGAVGEVEPPDQAGAQRHLANVDVKHATPITVDCDAASKAGLSVADAEPHSGAQEG